MEKTLLESRVNTASTLLVEINIGYFINTDEPRDSISLIDKTIKYASPTPGNEYASSGKIVAATLDRLIERLIGEGDETCIFN